MAGGKNSQTGFQPVK